MAKEVGRNEPCVCGSTIKFKHCCERVHQQIDTLPATAQKQILSSIYKTNFLLPHFWKKYGKQKPIIHFTVNGQKYVCVGKKLIGPRHWNTFHDFLMFYIQTVFDPSWRLSELKKPEQERHITFKMAKEAEDFINKHTSPAGKATRMTASGAIYFLILSYDLYLLEHHDLLSETLINRLKLNAEFQGAMYEAHIFSSLLKAGFHITSIDHRGKEKSPDCVIQHKKTGVYFAVEMKSKGRSGYLGLAGEQQSPDQIKIAAKKQISAALKKETPYPLIIFLELNMPPSSHAYLYQENWFNDLATQITNEEQYSQKAAFLIFTNRPYHFVGNTGQDPGRNFLLTAINNPDFRENNPNVIEEKYPAIIELYNSLQHHTRIPPFFETILNLKSGT